MKLDKYTKAALFTLFTGLGFFCFILIILGCMSWLNKIQSSMDNDNYKELQSARKSIYDLNKFNEEYKILNNGKKLIIEDFGNRTYYPFFIKK